MSLFPLKEIKKVKQMWLFLNGLYVAVTKFYTYVISLHFISGCFSTQNTPLVMELLMSNKFKPVAEWSSWLNGCDKHLF